MVNNFFLHDKRCVMLALYNGISDLLFIKQS